MIIYRDDSRREEIYIYTDTSHSSSLKSVVQFENKRKSNIILFKYIYYTFIYIIIYFGNYKLKITTLTNKYYIYYITNESTNYKFI